MLPTLDQPNWPSRSLASPGYVPNAVFGIVGAMGFTYIAFEEYEIVVRSGAEAVLTGWKGQRRSQRRDIVLGSNVDTVAKKADADVMIERIAPDATGEADSIMVPIAGGPHSEFAASIAADVATQHEGHVVDDDTSREEAERLLDETAADLDSETTTTILEGDVVDTVVERTGEYDLPVVGATREGILSQFVLGSVPEQIGWTANGTGMMAKGKRGIADEVSGWF